MKIKIILIAFVLSCGSNFAQSDEEIAYAYLKRAEDNFVKQDTAKALSAFKKSRHYNENLNDSRVGRLGMQLHYQLGNFQLAKVYSKEYFDFVIDKTSEEYLDMLDLYVSIQEGIDQFNEELRVKAEKQEQERLRKQRLDSLHNVWEVKSKEFTLKVDKVFSFNKNNIAVYKKDKALGIIDHFGNIIKKASIYEAYLSYDNLILLLDKKNKPTQIYIYNCEEKDGFLLPKVTAFNTNSNHYGKVMLPRGNDLIVTYPDQSNKTLIFNLKTKNFQDINDVKSLLRAWNKNDIIEKYSKEDQLRINKEWFYLGNDLGNNIYSLYSENKLTGYLNAENGEVLDCKLYGCLGSFYDGTHEILDEDSRLWIDAEGDKQDSNKNENGLYSGKSRFIKLENNNYIIVQNIEGKEYLVLGDKKLLNEDQFIAEATN